MKCPDSISQERLIAYYHGELDDTAADALDEHLFGCDACADFVARLGELEAGVRRAVAERALPLVLTEALRRDLEKPGGPLREFSIEPGGVTPCGAAADDGWVVLNLEADLKGIVAATVKFTDDQKVLDIVHQDVPVDERASKVSIAYPGALLRALPDLIVEIRVVLESANGEQQELEYGMEHSASGPPA